MHVEQRQDIDAAPERVWSVLVAIGAWPEWTESMDTVVLLTSGGLEPDAQVRIKQPKLPVTTWTVTAVDPGRAFTWVTSGPGVRSTATHTVSERTGGGSTITLTFHQGGLLGGFLGLVTAGLTRRYLAMEADGLKARAESPEG